ncbi:MAG: hypothetical protein AABZ60_11250 [Planctomycetota bacterium]
MENFPNEKKRQFLSTLGTVFYIIGIVVGGPVMIFLLIQYQIRFVEGIPTLALMFVPMILGGWCKAFAWEPSKRGKAIALSAILTVLILSALVLASVYH